jgi:hypothetical protein
MQLLSADRRGTCGTSHGHTPPNWNFNEPGKYGQHLTHAEPGSRRHERRRDEPCVTLRHWRGQAHGHSDPAVSRAIVLQLGETHDA